MRYIVRPMQQQAAIIAGIAKRYDDLMYDVEGRITTGLLKNQLSSARRLLSGGEIRGAGTEAGVALEAHLKNLAKKHSLHVSENMQFTQLNKSCRTEGLYDDQKETQINAWWKTRVKCAHAKKTTPTEKDVEELINGVKDIIKAVK